MNQHAGAALRQAIRLPPRRGPQSCPPIGEEGGKEIHRKRSRLLEAPLFRLRPRELPASNDALGKSIRLRVPHYIFTAGKNASRIFPARNKRRLWPGSIR